MVAIASSRACFFAGGAALRVAAEPSTISFHSSAVNPCTPRLCREPHECRAGRRSEFLVDRLHVVLDGAHRPVLPVGDVLVCSAARDVVERSEFRLGERGEVVEVGRADERRAFVGAIVHADERALGKQAEHTPVAERLLVDG